jgi:hypothetical protein
MEDLNQKQPHEVEPKPPHLAKLKDSSAFVGDDLERGGLVVLGAREAEGKELAFFSRA